MRDELVRVTVEFELPHGRSLDDCMMLVRHQMKASPEWEEPGGTGNLNYVCYDPNLRIVSGEIVKDEVLRR